MNNEEKILAMLEGLTGTVSQMQTDFKQMQGDISDLKKGQARLEQGQARLEQRQDKLEQGQVKLEQGQSKLEADVEFIKNTVTVMENEHGNLLNALHDGYSMVYDISNQIRDDIKYLMDKDIEQDIEMFFINKLLHETKKEV